MRINIVIAPQSNRKLTADGKDDEILKSATHKFLIALRKYRYAIPVLLFAGLAVFAVCNIQLSEVAQTVSPAESSQIESTDSLINLFDTGNRDTVGWVRIPDTNIDYPIQQSADNDYYLRRDAQGNPDNHGCIFADYECHLTSAYELSRNLILYGHTFSDPYYDEGFEDIHQYQNQEFGETHPYIYVSLQNAVLTYQVFSVGACSVADGYDCIYADPEDTVFQVILDKAMKRSIYDFGIAVGTNDHILTLSTCTGFSQSRLLVVAKLIDARTV